MTELQSSTVHLQMLENKTSHLEDWKYSSKELQSITMSTHTPHCMVPNHIFHLAVEVVNAFVKFCNTQPMLGLCLIAELETKNPPTEL